MCPGRHRSCTYILCVSTQNAAAAAMHILHSIRGSTNGNSVALRAKRRTRTTSAGSCGRTAADNNNKRSERTNGQIDCCCRVRNTKHHRNRQERRGSNVHAKEWVHGCGFGEFSAAAQEQATDRPEKRSSSSNGEKASPFDCPSHSPCIVSISSRTACPQPSPPHSEHSASRERKSLLSDN